MPRTYLLLVLSIVIGGCSSSTTPPAIHQATPVIRAITPQEGPAGTVIEISGSDFGSFAELRVMIGADLATIDSSNSTTIWTRIPSTATASSVLPIKVISGKDTAASPTPFTVNSAPSVTDISPASGYHGQLVEILGVNLSSNGVPLTLEVKFFGSDSIVTTNSHAPSDPFYVRVPYDAQSGVVSITSNGHQLSGAGWPTFSVLTAPFYYYNSVAVAFDNFYGSTLHYNNVTRDSIISLDTLSMHFSFTSDASAALHGDTSIISYRRTEYVGSSAQHQYTGKVTAVVDTDQHILPNIEIIYSHNVIDLAQDNSSEGYRIVMKDVPYTNRAGDIEVNIAGAALLAYVTTVSYGSQTSNPHGGGEVGKRLVDFPSSFANARLTLTLSK